MMCVWNLTVIFNCLNSVLICGAVKLPNQSTHSLSLSLFLSLTITNLGNRNLSCQLFFLKKSAIFICHRDIRAEGNKNQEWDWSADVGVCIYVLVLNFWISKWVGKADLGREINWTRRKTDKIVNATGYFCRALITMKKRETNSLAVFWTQMFYCNSSSKLLNDFPFSVSEFEMLFSSFKKKKLS